MPPRFPFAGVVLAALLMSSFARAADLLPPASPPASDTRTFSAHGVVMGIKSDIVIIRHGAISNYMDGMTMPFKVKVATELAGVQPGDVVSFQLHVTDTASWVDHLVKTGSRPPGAIQPSSPRPAAAAAAQPEPSLLHYKFTNELGQAVSLADFHGQALAITFFYTRCPLPDYCPRLSKNFQQASQKLASLPGAPANWHFLSVSFDTEADTPAVLKAYGESYRYDSKHWSFLTGPADKIDELARQSGVTYDFDAGTINHNFRTLIIDAAGHLQMIFPTAGDLSDAIVAQILQAAAVTNQPLRQN